MPAPPYAHRPAGTRRRCAASLVSIDDYRAIRHPVPYILRLRTSRGSLLYYGARHDYDPASPQAADIQRRWAEVRPGLALHEGGPRPPSPTVRDGVRSYGEAGLVHALAERDGVPLRGLEPPPADEVRYLLDSYTAEQVKLHYVLRQVLRSHNARRMGGSKTKAPGSSNASRAGRISLAPLKT